MKQLKFDDFFSFAIEVSDMFDELIVKDEDVDIAIIAKFDEARIIIPELLSMDYDMESVELHRPSWENYFDEYIISLNRDGVWCEPMKRDNGYLNDDSTVTYILGNCSSKVIKHCIGEGMIFEVHVDNYDDEFDGDLCIDCCDCVGEDCPMKCKADCKDDEKDGKTKHVECSKDENEDLYGFTASKSDGNSYYSCSVYTSDKLSLKNIQSLLQEVGF